MGTSTPSTLSTGTTIGLTLPPGVTLGPFRETSQTNAQGQVVQGVLFPVSFPNGSQTTVFIPYSLINSQQQVQALFDERINGLLAIAGS